MKNSPVVSVLMSVYNGEPYVREAIRSILDQTFQDFEFLIIDNASTDGSPETVSGFRDSRIRLIRNEANLGPPRALNQGLGLVRGAYVARMDADDVSLPDRLERQVRFLAVNPECAAVGTQVRNIDQAGRPLYEPVLPMTLTDMLWKLMFMSPLAHSSVMLRRDAVRNVAGYDERFRYAADGDLWSRLIQQGHRLANLPDVLTLIRIHGAADGVAAIQSELIDEVTRISVRNIEAVVGLRVSENEARKVVLLVTYHRCPSEDIPAALRTLETIAAACVGAVGRGVVPCYGRTLIRIAVSTGHISRLARMGLLAKGLRLVLSGTDVSEARRFLRDWVVTGRFVGAIRLAWRRAALRGSGGA